MVLPIDRFLNLVHFYMTEGADQKDVDKFDLQLNLPPVGAVRRDAPLPASSPWAPENETAALGGLAAALKGG